MVSVIVHHRKTDLPIYITKIFFTFEELSTVKLNIFYPGMIQKKNKLLAPLKELRWRPPTVINQVEDINPTSSLRYKVKYLPLGHRAKKHTARLGSQASLTGVHTHHHRLCCLQHNQCRIPGLQESSKTQNLFHNCLIISKMSTITDNFLENI